MNNEAGDRVGPPPSHFILDQRVLAFLVGLVALLLPLVMIYGAVGEDTCFYDSISHFYYAQFLGNIFVGALVFIGTFLLVYRAEKASENVMAALAGLAAYGVALFPTAGRGCEETEFSGRLMADMTVTAKDAPIMIDEFKKVGQAFQLFENATFIHYGSAAFLFGFLAYYSLFVFTRTVPELHFNPDGTLTEVKRVRNSLYRASGWTIVFCLAVMALQGIREMLDMHWPWWDDYNLTFWFEALALWAFAISWMVKGRFWPWGKLMDPREISTGTM